MSEQQVDFLAWAICGLVGVGASVTIASNEVALTFMGMWVAFYFVFRHRP